jgi:hypothetical protein
VRNGPLGPLRAGPLAIQSFLGAEALHSTSAPFSTSANRSLGSCCAR